MVDLYDRDKGNISLPVTLQSYDNNEDQKQKPTIINMQKAFYDIRIADIKNRINRLENRNNELLEEIETTNELFSTVDAETAEEIASLNKCKNEMYECLLDLAAQFQLETNKHISPPNQRLMRENVMLKNELLQISKDISSKMDMQKLCDRTQEKDRYSIFVYETKYSNFKNTGYSVKSFKKKV
ncbi:hypothetical protein ANTQUA_LOCUS3621 [Anthophora quadrimaculata]